MNKKSKILNITHSDLDGISCEIISKLAFNNPYIIYCSYGNIDKVVSEILIKKDYLDYDRVFITDISCNEDLAKEIDSINKSYLEKNKDLKFIIIDHHTTAEHLNQYTGFNVKSEDGDFKLCGAYSYLNFLKELNFTFPEILNKYIELVRLYDTWEWEAKKEYRARNLNNLFYMKSSKRFVENMIQNINDNVLFNETDHLLLDIDFDSKDFYFKQKRKEVTLKMIDGILFGVVFAEDYISELCSYLQEELDDYGADVDGIICIGPNSISYRTQKENIDVSKIAAKYGGGGHVKASGSRITADQKNQILKILFNIE